MTSSSKVIALALLMAAQSSAVRADEDDFLLNFIPILATAIAAVESVAEGGSYANQKLDLHINRQGIRSAQFGGTFVHAVGYTDFDGDLDDDVIMSSGDGSTGTGQGRRR